jgi:rhamnosyl/mannosyltransferase
MKVLQINKLYCPWVGGVEKIVQQISEGLNSKNDIEIEVLCCNPKGKFKEEIINGVKVHRASSLGIVLGMPISFDFFKLFKNIFLKFDIIDIHHPFPIASLAYFIFNPKVKTVVHYHSDIVRQKVLLRPAISHTLKRADKIIVSSPNIIESSPYLEGVKQKCEIIPFGVDPNNFRSGSEEKIKKIKEKYGKFILFVGRLNYYKGVEYLIDAMKDIESKLVIIGSGSLEKELKNKVKKLKISEKIFFLSALKNEDLVNFYRASDLLVLPSIFRSEAFGIVLIEAMAYGKPVISTDLGTGTSFINKDGITGFVVPPKDSKSLSSAIKKIITDDKKAKELGKNAFNRVKEEFSLEKMLKKTVSVYQNIQTEK